MNRLMNKVGFVVMLGEDERQETLEKNMVGTYIDPDMFDSTPGDTRNEPAQQNDTTNERQADNSVEPDLVLEDLAMNLDSLATVDLDAMVRNLENPGAHLIAADANRNHDCNNNNNDSEVASLVSSLTTGSMFGTGTHMVGESDAAADELDWEMLSTAPSVVSWTSDTFVSFSVLPRGGAWIQGDTPHFTRQSQHATAYTMH